MFLTVSTVVFLIVQNLVFADETPNKSTELPWHYSYTIGIIVGSVLVTITGTGVAYFVLKRMARKWSKSEYYPGDIPMEKDGSECYHGDEQYVAPQRSNLYQIQPILTVSEVVSSIKQSFEDMSDVVLPQRWTRPKQIANQEVSVEDKHDLWI